MRDVSQNDLIGMLRLMLLIRRFEEIGLRLRLEGKMFGAFHPYIGQEAVAVGVCSALERRDKVTSYHRSHGHVIAKGTSTSSVMAELFGRRDGCCKGKGGSMHLADISTGLLGANGIVAAGIPQAVGAALALDMLDRGAIAVTFFGDGATGQGVLYESLNIAALLKLPVVFVCDNNQYTGPTPISEVLSRRDIAGIADTFDMPGITVDGTDVVEVFDAARTAVEQARAGDGPSFLDCKSYRWGVHSQRSKVLKEGRPPEELAAAMQSDPIERLKSQLLDRGLISIAAFGELAESVERELADAVAFAESSPFPAPEEALDDVFDMTGAS
jgi:acetoin:2,6-dichlorophenolindophenol oxidoreductase subunit alpha